MIKTFKIFILILILFLITPLPLFAAIDDDPINARDLNRNAVLIKPQKATSALSFIDDKSNIYGLTSLDVPEWIAPDTLNALNKLIIQKSCVIYQTKNEKIGRINRMGENIGHFECGNENIWLQKHLLENGLARVRTTPENNSLSVTMLKIENIARDKKIGLWDKPEYAILTPEIADKHINSFQIIKGSVYSVAKTHEFTYLNFSPDWKNDFTIGVPTKLLRGFAVKHINLQSLKGYDIQVRGWIREYNGAYIELDHVEQLEILGQSKEKSELQPMQESIGGMHSIRQPTPPIAPKVTN